MNESLASTILDTISDSLELHVGFCRWSDDVEKDADRAGVARGVTGCVTKR